MTCHKCFRELEAESAFCRYCGARVKVADAGRRLARIPHEGRVAGVCAGLAAYFDADPSLVRLAWVALSIVPGVLIGGLVAYVAAWVLLPVGGAQDRHSYSGTRLLRSETNRQIAGICGGLADYLGVDSTIVRLVAVVLAIYPGAVIGGVVVYLIAWLIIPSAHDTLQSVSTTA
jgi:phage shock protein PspC (stress-responsive transcriptional regulator)